MRKFFKVAENVFTLELSDSSALWPLLTQYDPFEVEASGGEPVFSLGLTREIEQEPLEVVYDVPTEKGETKIRLSRCASGWIFEMAPSSELPVCGRLFASPDFSEGRLQILSRRAWDAQFAVNNSLMLLYAFTTAERGILEVHASVIKYEGRGYLFLAKSGTGKSTQSRMWLENIEGATLLNDDNPIVRVSGDQVVVYGSPWSGKTPCYINDRCPVGGFVLIRRAQSNRITRLGIVEAYANLYSSCSGLRQDRRMADGLHSSLEKAVCSVPSYVLDCLPDADAARVCCKGVLEGLGE